MKNTLKPWLQASILLINTASTLLAAESDLIITGNELSLILLTAFGSALLMFYGGLHVD